MEIQTVAQVVVGGILLGGLYALAAGGLNLIFGVMRIINVAHGEFLMVGAYSTFLLWEGWRINPLLSLPLAMLTTFLLGWVLYRMVVSRVVDGPPMMSLVVTFGLSVTIVNLALYYFGAVFRSVPVFSGSIEVAGLALSRARGIAFLAALAVTALVWWFLQRTTLGKAVRATAQSAEMALACGIDVERVRRFTFGLGAALAGAAGSLIIFILAISPSIGQSFILKAFAIVVIGGLGSFLGALAGGLILAVAEALAAFATNTQTAEAVAYLLLILVLLARPQGLLGLGR